MASGFVSLMNSYVSCCDEFVRLSEESNKANEEEQLLLDQAEFDSVSQFEEWVEDVRKAREILLVKVARVNICGEKRKDFEWMIKEFLPQGVWVKFNEKEGVCVSSGCRMDDARVIIRKWSSPMPKL